MAHLHNPVDYSDRQATIAAAKNAVARLNAIITDIDGYTTAQLKAALKDIATYERALIRIVAGSI